MSMPNAPTVHVTPASAPDALHVKVGVAVKLLMEVRVSVDVPLFPGAMVKVLGETLREKSEAPLVKLETLDHAPFRPVPEGARA